MALFHRHPRVDAILTAVSWRRETTIQHSHMEWVPGDGGSHPTPGHWQQVWTDGRVVASSGDSQEGLHWTEFSLWPQERVHKQTETYTAAFTAVDDAVPEDEREITAHLHQDVWQSLRVGSTYTLEFNILGHVHSVVAT
jgi:hypothetical protein